MVDVDNLIKEFIKNFVQKDRAERSYAELSDIHKRSKFINRLNHDWEAVLNMKRLVRVPKEQDNAAAIQRLLGFKDDELCYVISSYGDYDGMLLPFKAVFEKVYAKGLATVLVNTSATVLFLDTEQEQGAAPRFVGKL